MTATFATAPTHQIDVASVPFSYREFGPKGGTPLVLLNHLTGVLEDWDPRVVDGLAAKHHVIIFNNRGVGSSGGATPASVGEMADDAAAFITALGLTKVNLLGFSLGGCVAQALVQKRPELVERLILAGTAPAGNGAGLDGKGNMGQLFMEAVTQATTQQKHPKQLLFFTQSAAGQAAAGAYLKRLQERTQDRDPAVSRETVQAQIAALVRWSQEDPSGLAHVQAPTFIANGDHDAMLPTAGSFELLQRIPGAQLAIYPDAGHGGIFQFHELFVAQVLEFLAA